MKQHEKSYPEILTILIQKDAVLAQAAQSIEEELVPFPETDVYQELLNSIVSQQLSVKVAHVIWNRFLDLFPERYPHAEVLKNLTTETLRGAGLSRQKSGYLQNVAAFALENDMSLEYLQQLNDEAIITYLTSIKGIGKWTVQMVLMFPMDRPDVFPVDDLGIQTKMKQWYELDEEKKALKVKMEEIADQWKPYRSLAAKLLWKSDYETFHEG